MSVTIDPAAMATRVAHTLCQNPSWMVEEFNGDFNIINWTASEANMRRVVFEHLNTPTPPQLTWPEIDE